MNQERFEELKRIILDRAHTASACKEQYGRAYRSETVEELMTVIKDNFNWATNNNVLDGSLIETYSDEFNANRIWHNHDCFNGYLIASGNATVRAFDNATVRAFDNATVRAFDNATVEAYGNATVEAYGNATVEAYGNATVEAYDNATVEAYGNATVEAYGNVYVASWDVFECKLSNSAIWRIRKENIIRYADDNMKFEKITQ